MTQSFSPASGALVEQATSDYREKRYRDAGAGFERASQAYLNAGEPEQAAEMANNACVAFLQAGDPHKALELVASTPDTFLSAGDLSRASLAFGNRANALAELGRRKQAEGDYRRALEGFQKLGDDQRTRETRQALSALRLRDAKPLEALTEMQLGLEGQRQLSLRDRIVRWILRLPTRILPR